MLDPRGLQQPVDLDLSTEAATRSSANKLTALLKTDKIRIAPVYDQKTEQFIIQINKTQHGIEHRSRIDADFAQSGDYVQIKKTAAVLQGLLSEGAYVKYGEHQQPVKVFRDAIDWVLNEAQRGVSVQRYKGLGEMNPSQLWETTMDPKVRRLLRAQIEDAIGADEIFSTLMGDAVEPRRNFIESNALGVRNLDV